MDLLLLVVLLLLIVVIGLVLEVINQLQLLRAQIDGVEDFEFGLLGRVRDF